MGCVVAEFGGLCWVVMFLFYVGVGGVLVFFFAAWCVVWVVFLDSSGGGICWYCLGLCARFWSFVCCWWGVLFFCGVVCCVCCVGIFGWCELLCAFVIGCVFWLSFGGFLVICGCFVCFFLFGFFGFWWLFCFRCLFVFFSWVCFLVIFLCFLLAGMCCSSVCFLFFFFAFLLGGSVWGGEERGVFVRVLFRFVKYGWLLMCFLSLCRSLVLVFVCFFVSLL